MKINENFLLREVAGNKVVMPVGEAADAFSGMIKLNGTGAYLFEKIQGGITEEELISAMLADYEVDEATARQDIARFVDTLRKMNILEE